MGAEDFGAYYRLVGIGAASRPRGCCRSRKDSKVPRRRLASSAVVVA